MDQLEAIVFAKAAAQIQFFTQALVEGAIVEITGDKQRIRQFQSNNGLKLSIEILDAKLGFIGSNQPQAGGPHSNAAPASAPQQSINMEGGYTNNSAGRPMNQEASMAPPIDFNGNIPFAPIGLQYKRLLHCI